MSPDRSHCACSAGHRACTSSPVCPSQSPKSVSTNPSTTWTDWPNAVAIALAVCCARRSGELTTAATGPKDLARIASSAACRSPSSDNGRSLRPEKRRIGECSVEPCRTSISRVATPCGGIQVATGAHRASPAAPADRAPACPRRYPSPGWRDGRRACWPRAGSTRASRSGTRPAASAASRASWRMVACLICQRPDICSITSLESMRITTSVAPSSFAASRPAIRPRYSATLLVSMPM